jgi:two-component system, OmpR family, KDP operon response regulator KdpE
MTVASGRPSEPGPATRPQSAAQPGRAEAGGLRILLVEDEPSLLRALLINLRARQYQVVTAGAGREALAAAARRPPDAVILDLGLPDIDGTEVIAELRRWSRTPIIVLSGRASPGDKIGALDAGADDYVTKPFSMAELLARLRAVLRRDEVQPPGPTVAVVGRCVVDLVAHTVTRRPAHGALAARTGSDVGIAKDGEDMTPDREDTAKDGDDITPDRGDGTPDRGDGTPDGETVRLTPTEWQILESLIRRPGQLVSARQLLTEIWGPGYEHRTNYLRFHMARLRRKLEDNPARPRHLLTEPGMGYRYQP